MKALFILLMPVYLMMFVGCGDKSVDQNEGIKHRNQTQESNEISGNDDPAQSADVDLVNFIVSKPPKSGNFYIYKRSSGIDGSLLVSYYEMRKRGEATKEKRVYFSKGASVCLSVPVDKFNQIVNIRFSSLFYPNTIICQNPASNDLASEAEFNNPCLAQNYIIDLGEPSGWWFIGEGGKYSVEVTQEIDEETKASCQPLFSN